MQIAVLRGRRKSLEVKFLKKSEDPNLAQRAGMRKPVLKFRLRNAQNLHCGIRRLSFEAA
jgi:hypothetical protein